MSRVTNLIWVDMGFRRAKGQTLFDFVYPLSLKQDNLSTFDFLAKTHHANAATNAVRCSSQLSYPALTRVASPVLSRLGGRVERGTFSREQFEDFYRLVGGSVTRWGPIEQFTVSTPGLGDCVCPAPGQCRGWSGHGGSPGRRVPGQCCPVRRSGWGCQGTFPTGHQSGR